MASPDRPGVGFLALLLTSSSSLIAAAPSITFPINSQVPPVARVGQPFSFVFSPSTFSSTSAMTYTLADPPAWLTIDTSKRILSGTPTDADVAPGQVVGVPISLVATDSHGSATLAATLVVSRNPSPVVSKPFAVQAPQFGAFLSPSTLVEEHGASFSFTLAPDTFSGSATPLNYYLVTADHTPLPAWISLHPSSLTVTGQAPPLDSLSQLPQSFAFQLIASDVVGFAAVSMPFNIVVGQQETPMDQRTTSGPSGTSQPSVTSHPSRTSQPSGTSQPNLFVGSLPSFHTTPGNHFATSLESYLTNPADTNISITTTPPVDWLRYQVSGQNVAGVVPATFGNVTIIVAVRAVSRASGRTESETFSLEVTTAATQAGPGPGPTVAASTAEASAGATTTMSAPGSSNTAGTASEPTSPPQAGASSRPSNTRLLAILVPVGILLLTTAIIICCLLRRLRRRSGWTASIGPARDISGPIPGSLMVNSVVVGHDNQHSIRSLRKQYDAEASPRPGSVIHVPASAYLGFRETRVAAEGATPTLGRAAVTRESVQRGRGRALSWRRYLRTSAGAAAAVLKPAKQARKSKSRSYLSDSSLSEAEPNMPSSNSLGLPGHGSRASFRDGLEVNMPASVKANIGAAVYDAEKQEQQSGSAAFGFLRPWRRSRGAPPHPGLLSEGARTQASLFSCSTIDTFAYKRKGKSPGHTPVLGSVVERNSTTEASPTSLLNELPPLPLKAARSGPIKISDRRAARTISIGSNYASMGGTEDVAGRLSAMDWAPSRDPLGIAKFNAEEIGISPFHPTKTWSTVHSDEEGSVLGDRPVTRSRREHVGDMASMASIGSRENWKVLSESPEPWLALRGRTANDSGVDGPNKGRKSSEDSVICYI